MLRCGLFRTNGVLAMGCVSFEFGVGTEPGPRTRHGVAVPGPATLLRRLCSADAWREEGQPRAPASHAAAVAPCGSRPAGFHTTATKNTPTAYGGGATDFPQSTVDQTPSRS